MRVYRSCLHLERGQLTLNDGTEGTTVSRLPLHAREAALAVLEA